MLRFELSESKAIPVFFMAIYTMYASFSFAAVEMMAYSYLQLALLLLTAFFSCFLMIRKRTFTHYDMAVMFFIAFVLAMSLLMSNDYKQCFYELFALFLLVFSFNYYKKQIRALLIGACIGFSFAVFTGTIHTAIHPEMWIVDETKDDVGYLLGGNYNQMGCRVLCAVLVNALCLKISRWFIIPLMLVIVSGLSLLFMVNSMTSITCIILFLLLCVIPNKRLQRFCICSLMAFVLLFEFLVCFSGKGLENNEFATWFIVDVLGKDVTFTNRTGMWDSALRIISESPIWGHGLPNAEWYMRNMSSFAVGPHNGMLAMLIYGGIITFGIYLYCLFTSLSVPYKFQNRMSNVMMASVVVLSVMMLMEIYPLEIIFFLFTLSYYYNYLEVRTKNER
jgi:O-antigen ligase